MKVNWKKAGIIAAAIVGTTVSLKLMPLWASLIAIGCAVGGFISGYYWFKKKSEK